MREESPILPVSHGIARRRLAIGMYAVTEARYAANQCVPRHEHALSSWTLVISGRFEEAFSRETLVCGAGSLLTKPYSADHRNRYGPEGARCLLVELDSENNVGSPGLLSPDRPRTYSSALILTRTLRLARHFESSDALTNLVIEEMLFELSAAVGRMNGSRAACSKAWLNAVRDQMEAEFRSPPTLSELADLHGRHPAYVCQEFRRAFGTTLGEYVRRVRFEWAREALRAGTRRLSDIALAAGFSDQAHFNREVRRRTGMSPSALAAALRSTGDAFTGGSPKGR